MPPRYRHTQIGYLVLAAVAATLALNAWIVSEIGWHPMFVVVGAVLLGVAVVFSTLTVEIAGDALECRFGPGVIRKRFTLDEIRETRPVKNRWYYGWGVRWTPSGWMYNVSGLDAVEVSLADGKKFFIGTDQPAELTAAIRQAIG